MYKRDVKKFKNFYYVNRLEAEQKNSFNPKQEWFNMPASGRNSLDSKDVCFQNDAKLLRDAIKFSTLTAGNCSRSFSTVEIFRGSVEQKLFLSF